jgi:hypothetical protein
MSCMMLYDDVYSTKNTMLPAANEINASVRMNTYPINWRKCQVLITIQQFD